MTALDEIDVARRWPYPKVQKVIRTMDGKW